MDTNALWNVKGEKYSAKLVYRIVVPSSRITPSFQCCEVMRTLRIDTISGKSHKNDQQ
jgi:hypothetical protein